MTFGKQDISQIQVLDVQHKFDAVDGLDTIVFIIHNGYTGALSEELKFFVCKTHNVYSALHDEKLYAANGRYYKAVGTPSQVVVPKINSNEFLADKKLMIIPTYVKINDYTLGYLGLFKKEFRNALIAGAKSGQLIDYIKSNYTDLRTFLYSNLDGWKESIAFDTEHNAWTRLQYISSQTNVGEIKSFRVTDYEHVRKIINKLNTIKTNVR